MPVFLLFSVMRGGGGGGLRIGFFELGGGGGGTPSIWIDFKLQAPALQNRLDLMGNNS